jgi:hypothetical protein
VSGTEIKVFFVASFRYVAVCAPFFRLKHNLKARFYILPILLFAPLYNMPRFFEFRSETNVTYRCVDHLVNSNVSRLANDLNLDFNQQNVSSINSNLVLTEDDFLKLNYTIECQHWNKKTLVDLVVTEFRKNQTYITVST